MRFVTSPGGEVSGELRVPGDKSISHRAAMLAAIAEGDSEIRGFLEGDDCIATLEAFAADYAVGPGDWALAALSTGDNSSALEWLERGIARPSPGPGWGNFVIIARNGFSDPVLERPEFVEIRKHLPR